jgi:CHAT domain-containing protein
LLFYHIAPEAAFVLAANGDTAKTVRLPVEISTLRSAVDSLTAPFHHADEKSVHNIPFRAAIAYRLYNMLIKPVEAAMTLPPRLLIVPDLALMNLPFEMLLTKRPDAAEYASAEAPTYAKDFLVQRYTTVYSPSTSLLLEREVPSPKHSNALVFANPFGNASRPEPAKNTLRSMTGWRFDPLPYAEVEARQIQEIQSQAQVHKRENAAKTNRSYGNARFRGHDVRFVFGIGFGRRQ